MVYEVTPVVTVADWHWVSWHVTVTRVVVACAEAGAEVVATGAALEGVDSVAVNGQ